jgi:hypothetical protein
LAAKGIEQKFAILFGQETSTTSTARVTAILRATKTTAAHYY